MNPQTITQEPSRSLAGESARERMLRDLPVTSRTLSLAGISTPVLEGGKGPPVILLHGPAGYALQWLRVIPHLVSTHRIIAPDLPGHGASEVKDGSLDVSHVIRWLDELITATCTTPPIVLAQALGGAIALRYAAGHGDRIERLVLVDALGLAPFEPSPEFGAALQQFLSQPTKETHGLLWQQCAYDLEVLKSGMGDQWAPFESYNIDRATAPGVLPMVMKLMEEFGMSAIPPKELERITVPTTLVWGRHARAIPLTVAETASERFGWPLVIIEDSANDPPMDQPEAVARVVRR
jgi:pimeloyl-ACP methyl ester carboxylesterase